MDRTLPGIGQINLNKTRTTHRMFIVTVTGILAHNMATVAKDVIRIITRLITDKMTGILVVTDTPIHHDTEVMRETITKVAMDIITPRKVGIITQGTIMRIIMTMLAIIRELLCLVVSLDIVKHISSLRCLTHMLAISDHTPDMATRAMDPTQTAVKTLAILNILSGDSVSKKVSTQCTST